MDLKFRRGQGLRIRAVVNIVIAWTAISVLQILFGHSTMVYYECDLSHINVGTTVLSGVVVGMSAGILGGTLLVYFWEQWLRTLNYGVALLWIFISYTVVFLIVSTIANLFLAVSQTGQSILDSSTWHTAFDLGFGLSVIQSYIIWLLIVIGTLIAMLVNDKYGPGVFRKFLLGKYFKPTVEDRLFMFLDLRSSTTIAEQLGERQYFSFLRDVVNDVTPVILKYEGEIYQYVGDEIVISWKTDKGITQARCLECFFEMCEALLRRKDYYMAGYGVQPEYKAGLHAGRVMAGEIGLVKRDIAYSGDVLNTTSRIQSKCNDFGVDILLSESLLTKLTAFSDLWSTQRLGEILLRGKSEEVVLFTVSRI